MTTWLTSSVVVASAAAASLSHSAKAAQYPDQCEREREKEGAASQCCLALLRESANKVTSC